MFAPSEDTVKQATTVLMQTRYKKNEKKTEGITHIQIPPIIHNPNSGGKRECNYHIYLDTIITVLGAL